MKLRVQLEQNPTHEDRQRVFALLEDYNASRAGPEPELPLAVLVYGDDGTTIRDYPPGHSRFLLRKRLDPDAFGGTTAL